MFVLGGKEMKGKDDAVKEELIGGNDVGLWERRVS